jgi:hypothetical protein
MVEKFTDMIYGKGATMPPKAKEYFDATNVDEIARGLIDDCQPTWTDQALNWMIGQIPSLSFGLISGGSPEALNARQIKECLRGTEFPQLYGATTAGFKQELPRELNPNNSLPAASVHKNGTVLFEK